MTTPRVTRRQFLETSAAVAGTLAAGGKAQVTNTDGDNIRVRDGAGTKYDQVAEAHEGNQSQTARQSKSDEDTVGDIETLKAFNCGGEHIEHKPERPTETDYLDQQREAGMRDMKESRNGPCVERNQQKHERAHDGRVTGGRAEQAV